MTSLLRCARWILIAGVAVSLGACSSSDSAGSGTALEQTSTSSSSPARSNEELAAAWWSWAASEPDATNPVVDDTGEDCARNQPGDVWFLAGNFGGDTRRTCSLPLGQEVFFPVLNAICGEGDGCETRFDDAELSVLFDGEQIEPVEIDTDVVEIEATEGNSVTFEAGRFRGVVAGWWVRLPAPASGVHRLEISGLSADGFEVSVTYDITIS